MFLLTFAVNDCILGQVCAIFDTLFVSWWLSITTFWLTDMLLGSSLQPSILTTLILETVVDMLWLGNGLSSCFLLDRFV